MTAALRREALRAREPATGDPVMAEGLLRLDKSRPVLLLLFEGMNDFDEGVQE